MFDTIPTFCSGRIPAGYTEVNPILESLVANGTPRVIAEHWATTVRDFNRYSEAADTAAMQVAHAAVSLRSELAKGHHVTDFVSSKTRDLTEALTKREVAAQAVRSIEYCIREMAKQDGLVAS